jgi:hypothetical protein
MDGLTDGQIDNQADREINIGLCEKKGNCLQKFQLGIETHYVLQGSLYFQFFL